jgi:Fe-S cluster assembly protein SufD
MQKYKFDSESKELSSKREAALKAAEELEMPESIRTPGRTWTRYPEIDLEEIAEIRPEIDVEGDVNVFTGQKAIEEAADKFLDAIKTDENKLNAYHVAFMNSIIYLEVEGEAEVKILYDEEESVFSHLIVETGTSSDLTLTERFQGSPEVLISFNEFYLGDNTSMRYGAVESADAELSYSRRKAVVGRDASINWLNGIFEGQLSRTLIDTVLKGDGSETEMMGLWYPTDDQHIDIALHADHQGANTRCDMDSRAVVDDKSRSVYEGLQHVGDRADDTTSFQNEDVLMLSDKSEVDASPKLMIEDPNVEASHAASAGNLPKDQLHYLESRGLSGRKAENLIVKGFFEPVMQEIELPELKESIREEVMRKLNR